MLTENGRVVEITDQGAWVETVRMSSCQSCAARSGCGQHLLAKMRSAEQQGSVNRILVASDQSLQPGQEVQLGLDELQFLRAASLVYLLPLLTMLLPVVLARNWLSEPWLIALAGLGLLLGFIIVRLLRHRVSAQPECNPRVLQAVEH